MPERQDSAPTSLATRLGGVALAAAYALAILAVALFARPVNLLWLGGVALLPGAACFLLGVPKVVSGGPRGLLALFHLLVYPLLAAVALGLPGAGVAYLLAQTLSA